MASVNSAQLIDYLRDKGLKCSFAESLTGIVSYSDNFKMNVLGVPSEVIDSKTAVSAECAVAMAEGASRLSEADIAVSVTGYAGPGDGADGTPCGTVYIGFKDRNGSGSFKKLFEGSRDEIRQQTRDAAVELVYSRACDL